MTGEIKPNTSVSLQLLKDDLLKSCPSSVAAKSLINMRNMIETNNDTKDYKFKLNKKRDLVLQTNNKGLKLNYLLPIKCEDFRLAKY